MLQVAIVDDDDAIRGELDQMLAQLCGKCSVMLEAEDGDEVIGSPLLPNLDLILTDINMRRVDGIQLIRFVKERYPSIEIVVLSNYDDFSLVRDAMKYGASDYLLKYQLSQDALDTMLEVCRQKKRQNGTPIQDKQMQTMITSHLLRDFVNRRLAFPELLQQLKLTELPLETMNAALFLIYTQETPDAFFRFAPGLREYLRYQAYCYFWEYRPGCLAIVTFRHQTSAQLAASENYLFAMELYQQFLPKYRDLVVICRSETLVCPCDLPREMDALLECGCNIFYLGTGMLLDRSYLREFRTIDPDIVKKFHQDILNTVQRQDFDGFLVMGRQFLDYLRRDKCYPEQAKEFLISVFRELYFLEPTPQEDEFFQKAKKKLREHLCTLEEASLLFDAFAQMMEEQKVHQEHKAIQQAIFLIEQDYGKDLTLDQAAQACGYNKNYFCKLFKETYGYSFGEYLTRYRMEKAQQLLKNKFLPVNQVAHQVGMEYHHFCRIFKRFYQSTPSTCKQKQEPKR